MRILIIDDDTGMTDLLTILLTPANAKLITASTAHEGIKMVREQTPDLVILDLMLPEFVGWDVCRAIREFSNVPIMVLSAIDAPGIVAQALDHGADEYLTKPISSSILLAHINKYLRSGPLKKNLIQTANT